MIAFIGDVHREFNRLAGAVAQLPAGVDVAIQVGDLGLHGDDLGPTGPGVPRLNRPVYYVTGNHDYEPSYRGITRPTEMAPNLVFVPRGTVLELDGRRIAFLGGGDSVIDRARTARWCGLVAGRAGDYARCRSVRGVGRVDFLVCHTPPTFVYHFFGFPPDPSASGGGAGMAAPRASAGDLRPPAQVARGRPRTSFGGAGNPDRLGIISQGGQIGRAAAGRGRWR